tara:strand:- start:7871 stop:8314 length:444 start_codon:yes stop_codon:yes gene_type:complete
MRLAMNTLAAIKMRTSKGLDAHNMPFKGYSTKPIYVSNRGARLKPKGGIKTKGGVFYNGGYKQYKHESRRRGSSSDSAEVDLVLSGNMMNSLVVHKATPSYFIIGLNAHGMYGYAVNETREFLGLSLTDVDVLVRSIEIEIRKKLMP